MESRHENPGAGRRQWLAMAILATLMAAGFLVAALGFGLVGTVASRGDLVLLVAGYCIFSVGLRRCSR